MSKKYILNKTSNTLSFHDTKAKPIITLKPRQCSFQSFEEDDLLSIPSIMSSYQRGRIDLVSERMQIVSKNTAKDYGQKYKIGTRAYLNDKNNLDIEVVSYNPNNGIYKVKLLRTGGVITTQEGSITLKKNKGDSINVDIDENGELTDSANNATRDLSLPQEPEQVQIVHTEDKTINKAKNAKEIISNQDALAEEIANQKVDIIFKDEQEQTRPEDEEETFIVKTTDGKFAKEVSSSEMVKNTQKAINESLQEVIDSTKIAREEEKKEEFNQTAFDKLSQEMQDYITSFMSKDARNRKMIISRLKDVEKLSAIASCTDELSMKAARAKIEKLLAD